MYERVVAFRELVAPRVDPTTTAIYYLLNTYTFGKVKGWDEKTGEWVETDEYKDTAYPSKGTLAEFLGQDSRNVRRHLQVLEDVGCLVTVKEARGHAPAHRQLLVAPGYDKWLKKQEQEDKKQKDTKRSDMSTTPESKRSDKRTTSKSKRGDMGTTQKSKKSISRSSKKVKDTSDSDFFSNPLSQEKKSASRKKSSPSKTKLSNSASPAPHHDSEKDLHCLRIQEMVPVVRPEGLAKLTRSLDVGKLGLLHDILGNKPEAQQERFLLWVIKDPNHRLQQVMAEAAGKQRDQEQQQCASRARRLDRVKKESLSDNHSHITPTYNEGFIVDEETGEEWTA